MHVESNDIDWYEKQAQNCDDHGLDHFAPDWCSIVMVPVWANILVREPEKGEDGKEKKEQDKLKHSFDYRSVATALTFAATLVEL